MRNYYKFLGLSSDATDEQIRKAYRRLALQYHPDRNPGDPDSELRFKEIAEAYGVLIDPVKRQQYDQWRISGAGDTTAGRGFGYSQEEIFRDLFNDPRFSRVFQDLFKEFERQGVRFDQRFFEQTFFGGRGMLFGGFFVWTPFGSSRTRIRRPHDRPHIEDLETRQAVKQGGVLKRLGQRIGGYLLGDTKSVSSETQKEAAQTQDLVYQLNLRPEDAQRGTSVKIAIDRGEGRETLKVKIPPGTRSGTRLRIKGKGLRQGQNLGDLYLSINIV